MIVLKRFAWWALGVVISVLLSLWILVALGSLDYFRLQEIRIEGNKVVPTEAIASIAHQVLAGREWLVLPHDSSWFYPHGRLTSTLLTDLPRLASAQLAVSSHHTLTIKVTERFGDLVWCNGANLGDCYFIDQVGVAYSRAPQFSRRIFFEVISPLPNSGPILGRRPIATERLAWLQTLRQGLDQTLANSTLRNFSLGRVVLTTTDALFFVYSTQSVTNPEANITITTNSAQDPELMIDNLRLSLASPTYREQSQNYKLVPASFDLRFAGKVFYRFSDV